MFTEKNQEKNYQVLRQITFLFFLLAAFCSAGLMSLMTRFVSDFWLTKEYCLETGIVVVCVINFYSFIISLPTAMMMTVSGMFDKERNVSVLYAVINLVISLLLVKPLGVIGVLIGTLVSYLVQIFFRTWIFFRNYLKKSSKRYLLDILEYSVLAAAETWLTYRIVGCIYQNGGFVRFFLCILICVLIPNMANLFVFIRSWRLQSIIQMVKMIRRKKR
jgi:O-antigen/teichoic acid export membrane protein